jgi:photosystem II stability/assembly factor-like uncharacterized protein
MRNTLLHYAYQVVIACFFMYFIAETTESGSEIPPPASAYIQQIAIDHENPDIVYVATIGAGLFRTINGGAEWVEINREAGFMRYFVVAVDPKNASRLFAGGEHTGLWMSEDRGVTWSPIGPDSVTVCELSIDPSNPDRLFIVAPEGVYRNESFRREQWRLVFDYRAFLRTHWTGTHPDQLWGFSRFQKIAVNPHDPSDIYLGARWEGGYHRSTDGGETWNHEWITGIFRRGDPILFHPDDPDIVFMGTHHQGLFKSYNRGKSWVALTRGMEPQIRTPFYGAYLISGIVFEPGNPEVLYTGTDYSNWKTVDGGKTWFELGRTLTCEFARSFAVDPRRTDIVYAGTNVGMYKSYDGGKTWISVNRGFPEREVKQVLPVAIGDEQFEYAVVTGRPAVYRRSVTGGTDWISMSWMLYADGESISYYEPSGDLVLRTPDGEFRSSDGGFRWDVPAITFAPVVNLPVEAPFGGDRDDPALWTLDISLRGDVFFEDSLVDPLYQRPPYVSIQLVSSTYPCDKSEPVWETTLDRYLRGTIQIPRALLTTRDAYMFYVEVRDFQRNVSVGTAPVSPATDSYVEIYVAPDTLPPCLE